MGDNITGYRQLTDAEIKMINAVKGMCAGIARTIADLHKSNHAAGEELYKALQARGANLTSTGVRFMPPEGASEQTRIEIAALVNDLSLIDPSHNCLAQAHARLIEVEMWLVRAIAKPVRS